MLTQGTFAYLPELDDDEIAAQIEYIVAQGWAVSIEHTDNPHPRNLYWEMWGLPTFDHVDPRAVLDEIQDCRTSLPDHYVKVNAFDNRKGRETIALSFLVHRPATEATFHVDREHGPGRTNRYALRDQERRQVDQSRL